MKCLSKKLLSIFMVLCLTLMSFGLVINVNAANSSNDITFVVKPSNFGDKTIMDSTNTYSMTINYASVDSKTDYMMFNKNSGYMYSNSAVEGYYPSKLVLEFNSGASTAGKYDVHFGTDLLNGKKAADTVVLASGTKDFLNKNENNLYWNVSTSNRNVQLISIKVVYSEVSVQKTKLATPQNILYEDGLIMFEPVNSATGYEIGLFYDVNSLNSYMTFTTTETIYQIELPSLTPLYVRVKAIVENSDQFSNSDYSESVGTYVNTNKTAISIQDFLKFPVQTSAPFVNYRVEGIVNDIDYQNSFTIEDGVNTLFIYKPKGSEDGSVNINSKNIAVGDLVSFIGHRSEHNGKDQMKDGYLDTFKKPSMVDKFELLNTVSSLKASYIEYEKILEKAPGKVATPYSIKFADYCTNGSTVTNFTTSDGFQIEVSGNQSVTFDEYLKFNQNSKLIITSTVDKPIKKVTFGYLPNVPNENRVNNFKLSSGTLSGDTITIDQDNITKLTIDKTGGKQSRISEMTIECLVDGIVEKKEYSFEIAKDPEELSKNNVSLRFGGLVSQEIYDNLKSEGQLVNFGVVYTKASELNGKTFAEAVVDGTAHKEVCEPVLEGTDYFYSITINHIPTESFNDAVTAACYVEIDGVIHLMKSKEYSVCSIAEYYINNDLANADVKNNERMLRWLISLAK